ncbi:unnamed protein product, partial [Bubo scandiacus]
QKGVWKVTQARIKEIYDELEEKRKEKFKKRAEDMKKREKIERQVADLETKSKRNKDIFKDKHEKLSCLNQRLQELDKHQIAENSHTMENFKNELKELNELWNTKQIQMENTENLSLIC